MIKISNLSKSYDGNTFALRNIDLSIASGEFVAVIGKSGSGKSTLINMLAGIDHPTDGEVMVNDLLIHNLSENDLALWRGQNVGVVFQFFQLLPTLTAVENVMLPMELCGTYPRRQRCDRAMDILSQVEMDGFADQLPSELSGGQQQRVAIARALANDPALIVTDEPTGNLDSKTAANIARLLDRLADEGKTILMVTHDQDLTRIASRTVQLVDGIVYEDRPNGKRVPSQKVKGAR